VTPSSCNIELLWERTAIAFPVTTEIDSRIMKNIETALAADTRPYYQAASYYYDNNKDLGQALTWVNKAVDQNPKAYWVGHLKAKNPAQARRQQSSHCRCGAEHGYRTRGQDDDYVRMNEKLIAEARGKK
jgi:hypothetical protein